jgi:hypothetical protein
MSRTFRFTLLSILVLFTFACGLISNPLNQAKGLASTAEAIATAHPVSVSTIEALPSSMPLSTLEALPSSMPEVGQYLNPTGKPVSNWNDIPIMSQATAGQQFDQNTYSFKVNATATDVQTYYNAQLKPLGWSSSFSAQGGGQGGLMLLTKDSHVLSITIGSSNGNEVVVLIYH